MDQVAALVTMLHHPLSKGLQQSKQRLNYSEDEMGILDWDSVVMMDCKILDLGCRDVFVLNPMKTMLARSHGFLCLSVFWKPLWEDGE